MAVKLMYIPNNDTKNYPFCRLKSVVDMFEYSSYRTNQSKFIIVPKVIKAINKKTLGTSVINSPLSPLSL